MTIPTATPTSSSTVLGETAGVVRLFAVGDLGPYETPERHGAAGDGVTDDYTALQAAATAAASGVLYLADDYYTAAGSILTISSDTVICGPGKIIGPAVASQGLPTAYIKVQGALSTTVSFGSTISEGTASFTVSNTFAADDMLVLSNFPADATDAYTEGAANWKGEKSRAYADTSSNNLRQTRRRELCVVRSASGAAFELQAGTQHAYGSTASLQFQKVLPVSNVTFSKETTLENIWVLVDYARDITLGCRLIASAIELRSTLGVKFDIPYANQKDTGCLIDLHNSTTLFSGEVVTSGGNLSTDNALVRIDQVGTGELRIVASGSKGSMYACLIDTNFTENPLGYTDVPNGPCSIDVVANKCAAPNVFAACDPYAAKISDLTLNVVSDVVTNDAVYLKGVDGVVLQVAAKDARIRFDAVQNVTVRGQYASTYESTFVDSRGAGTQSNSALSLNGSIVSTCTLTLTGSTGDPTTPCTATASYIRNGNIVHLSAYFNSVDTTAATGDLIITGLPVAVRTGYRAQGVVGMAGFGAAPAFATAIASTVYIADSVTSAAIAMSAGAGKFLSLTITYPVD